MDRLGPEKAPPQRAAVVALPAPAETEHFAEVVSEKKHTFRKKHRS